MSLQEISPDIAAEFHPIKNGNLKVFDISNGSGKIVWWICHKTNCNHNCEHAYQTRVGDKTRSGKRKVGCPFCSGRKFCIHNSLLGKFPDIAAEFHPTKNGKLKAENFASKSHENVWWLCPKNCPYGCSHDYQMRISSRIEQGSNCPYCCNSGAKKICIHQSLKFLYPDIASEFHPTKNGDLKPENILPNCHTICIWKCDKKFECGCPHEDYPQTPNGKISKNNGCPTCKGIGNAKKFCIHSSLLGKFPFIAAEFHPTKNGDLKPENILPCSGQHVWWKCVMGHCWFSSVGNRTSNGTGCPHCSNIKQYSEKSFTWINYMEFRFGVKFITAKTEGGEHKIKETRFHADAYVPQTNTILEFWGSRWHGDARDKRYRHWKIFSKSKNITFGDKYYKTLEKIKIIKEKGYNLIEMWEYDWDRAIQLVILIQRKFKKSRFK